MSKRVPKDGRGAARRSYHASYAKSAKQSASKAAGANRPRTTKVETSTSAPPTRNVSRGEYSKSTGASASFGRTGHVEDI